MRRNIKNDSRRGRIVFLFHFFQLMGVLYLKASAYEFAGHNSLYNDTYWYSLEQSSKKSLAHLLNKIGLTQLPLFGRSPGKLQFDHRQTKASDSIIYGLFQEFAMLMICGIHSS